MTENKRFYQTKSTIEDYRIYDDDKEDAYFISCDKHTVDCLTDLLNELQEENQDLHKKEVELGQNYLRLLEENEQLRTKNNAYIQDIEVFKEENTHLKLKNEQLKERNNRQAKQLDKLYKLIEHQDWYKLNSIIQELKEADERLQEEWGNYGDVE